MESRIHSRQARARGEEGVALLITLMVLMLVSALMVGFVAAVIAETRASGLDRDQTQAYAASHAGLEQITSDLATLFVTDFSPTTTQINALRANPPALPGFSFLAPGDPTAGSGYMVAPRFTDGAGNPRPEDPLNGSAITAGPYQGFRGIITPYDITVTARSRGGAEVRMRRTLQTVAIPVFQFGMFSETDLAFHAGAEAFGFGGRVHTNGNLFLAAADGGSLTIADRITAVKDVVRTHLPNGLVTTSGYAGNVRIPTTIATNPVNNLYRNLARTEGSITGTVPPNQVPIAPDNSAWVGLSQGTYLNNIRNGDTGAKRLDLPLVADIDSNGAPDAEPIELIRRPAQGSNENAGTQTQQNVYSQRFFAMASVRILLSDTPQEIQSLPTVTQGTQPVALFGPLNVNNVLDYATPPVYLVPRAPLGNYEEPGQAWGPGPAQNVAGALPGSVQKGIHNESVHGGYIKIEIQRAGTTPTNGVWQDVTREVLSLGIAGRNLADSQEVGAARWNNVPEGGAQNDVCPEPHPNAIIRIQRLRDVPIEMGACGVTVVGGVVTAVSQNGHDYWPNTLYDTREAQTRDGIANTNTDLTLSGVMHYVELDVNNLRRWLTTNQFNALGAPNGQNAKNDNGYIVYFSDRRNNKNNAPLPVETGEYGFEDVTNPTAAGGAANGVMDGAGCQATHAVGEPFACLEDFNDNHVLDVYGRTARNVPTGTTTVLTPGWPMAPLMDVALWPAAKFPNPLHANTRVTDQITDANLCIGCAVGTQNGRVPVAVPAYAKPLVARANRALFFRRALKIVNGGIVGGVNSLPPGLTIAAENPVYVQGNYNSDGDFVETLNVPAAIIADAVTFLSNAWNDIRSFTNPTNSLNRVATTTSYRMAVITGKGIPFPQPAGTDASFGSDGGAHNFVRSLEDWDNGAAHRYRGSLVSFFVNRQGVGTFKCCDQDAYNRGPREWSFDTDFLSPARLPPGTPMFRDVNTLTFRQLLRPTQ